METYQRFIEIQFCREDFEEIYYQNRQASLFFNPQIKSRFFTVVIAFLLCIAAMAYSLITDKMAWLIVIFLLILLIAIYNYGLQALTIFKWRRRVATYLDHNESIIRNKLVVTDETITLHQDDVEYIFRWSAFTRVTINKSFISLEGNENYLFPKKSMSLEDYEFFSEIVRAKMQNGL